MALLDTFRSGGANPQIQALDAEIKRRESTAALIDAEIARRGAMGEQEQAEKNAGPLGVIKESFRLNARSNPVSNLVDSIGDSSFLKEEVRDVKSIASVPRPQQPPNSISNAPTAVDNIRSIGRNSFPLSKGLGGFLDKDQPSGPIATTFKENPVFLPHRAVARAGAGLADVVGAVTNLFVEGIRTQLGSKAETFSGRVKRRQVSDQTSGTLNFDKAVDESSVLINALREKGFSNDEIAPFLKNELFHAGLKGDLAEVLAAEILLQGAAVPGRIARGAEQSKRFSDIGTLAGRQATRANEAGALSK